MEEFVFVHYDLAISKMVTGYYAAGAMGCPDSRWNIPGNFWWARSDYLKTLPKVSTLNWANRWAAEGWICTEGRTGLYLDDYGDTVARDMVHFHDFHATILHLLGIDHTKLTYRHAGRDFRLTDVHGTVVKPILA